MSECRCRGRAGSGCTSRGCRGDRQELRGYVGPSSDEERDLVGRRRQVVTVVGPVYPRIDGHRHDHRHQTATKATMNASIDLLLSSASVGGGADDGSRPKRDEGPHALRAATATGLVVQETSSST